MRAIIVDDERPARDGLVADLTTLGVEVVAACADGRAAQSSLRELRPDVVFVDIEMPEIDGFMLLESLEPEELPPAIVFVTAYDEHALRAFEVRALDYVLKPFALDRLRAAVERAEQRVREARALASSLAPREDRASEKPFVTRLVIRERDGSIVVPVDDVDWIEAETYYVRLHLSNGRSRLMRERMAVLERQLDPTVFFRTHRSAIIRIGRIRSVRSLSRYEHTVTLSSGARVPLSRERCALLDALIGEKR
ncbi:MAG TPA: LytTR family DNA-binding domain-containing protein [Gemmatimonadaceae bacterium]|nr:LytTR family DNA-binding domain-containing protein [Gemmatimonadaceae bacterium]